MFRKSLILATDKDQILVKYELLKSPSPVSLVIKPFLAFRSVHALTHENDQANTSYTEIPGGVSFRMYPNFPDLHLQLSDSKAE